ncbi:M56 family metallopeptidase [Telluribacter sp. SYSU D00476]|uniref:M56 family metallopeptidase n=1 Tax=Telluribacter sp. SYSU D00476 TaxID=2811430 RepID=UPI001FF2A407|nr:M56 family metallopeptidase [Telluribacter sp. SYSU D00476]
MEALLYIGQVSLYWLLLYACYWLLLRQRTFFGWNRAYLLGSLLMAFVLPLVQYPEAAPPLPAVYTVSAPVLAVQAAAPSPDLFTWMNLLWLVYAGGGLYMAWKLGQHIRELFRFIRSGEAIEMEGYTLVLMNNNQVGSFSFLKWVVVNRSDYEHHFDAILNHELVHVQQRHSLDILLIEVLRVLFWFNPVLILYKRSLQQVHEYLADQQAPNRDHYAEFLVSYALGAPVATLTNHFFNSSLLKDRIKMLYKNPNSRWSLSTYAAVAVVTLLIALVVASCERDVVPSTKGKDVDAGKPTIVEGFVTNEAGKPIPGAIIEVKGTQTGTTTDLQGRFKIDVWSKKDAALYIGFDGYKTQEVKLNPKYKNVTLSVSMTPGASTEISTSPSVQVPSRTGDSLKTIVQSSTINGQPIFTVVEKVPEFPGGVNALFEYLGQNIKYPDAATRAKVQGKVFLSFVITTEGEIKDIQVLKGLGFGTDEEAIRVVSSMPRWRPGMQSGRPVNVKYNLPINFQLDSKTTTEGN